MVNPKKVVRKVLPNKVLRAVETEFRLARASYANARFNWPAKGMRVIMITGTNGKTTTAHYLFSILRKAGHSVGMLSTAEFKINEKSQINDTNMTAIEPVLLRKHLSDFKNQGADFVILEATSQSLDQHRLYGIPCEVAIMTNLTQDHLDYHKTMDDYARAKERLWNLRPKISVLNSDDEYFQRFLAIAKKKGSRPVTYGAKADITISGYKPEEGSGHFNLGLPDGKSVIKNPLAGEYNAYNAAAAAAAASALGIKGEAIEEGIESTQHIPGRLEYVPINAKFKVIVDYAHTADGLEKLLTAASDLTKKQLWLVFGACGDRDKDKRPVMGKVAARLADRLVVTDEESYSEEPADIRKAVISGIKKIKGGDKKFIEIADRKEAIKYAMDNAKKDDLILITGLGHEQFRVENGKKIAWNDTDVVKSLFTNKR